MITENNYIFVCVSFFFQIIEFIFSIMYLFDT